MTTLCNIPLQSFLMNASGCLSSTTSNIQQLDNAQSCGAIVSKSCTINPQNGNSLPRLYYDDDICINSMGLPNYGHQYYSNIKTTKPYIQSIYPHNINDISPLLDTNANIIEINLSCPNTSTHHKFENYEMYFDKIKQNKKDKIVGIKMAPIFDINDYKHMSNLLLKYDMNFITCSNTIPNCLVVDHNTQQTVIHPNNGLGGMSFKHISLANVYNFHKILNNKIDIIGCGGINNGKDVIDYILCGAKCIQLGSVLLRKGINVFNDIHNEVYDILHKKNCKSINDIYGKITICDAKL